MSELPTITAAITAIERAAARYPLISYDGAAVAFSGGKDSIALTLALRTMGVPVKLRAVDMGYSAAWRGRIEHLAARLDTPLEVLDVSVLMSTEQLDPDVRRDLSIRRAFLDSDALKNEAATPCTNCYNCKILSLVHGGVGAETLLFAHHATDVLASFLKSALMYHDRWHDGYTNFNRDRFRGLAQRVAADLRNPRSTFLDRFLRYLAEGHAQTSEPPVEQRTVHGRAYIVARPLFRVPERITAAIVAESGLPAESSGCGHTKAVQSRTPREIIHLELIPAVEGAEAGQANLERLMVAIEASLDDGGTISTDVRAVRHHLLGDAYKGGPAQLADKL